MLQLTRVCRLPCQAHRFAWHAEACANVGGDSTVCNNPPQVQCVQLSVWLKVEVYVPYDYNIIMGCKACGTACVPTLHSYYCYQAACEAGALCASQSMEPGPLE